MTLVVILGIAAVALVVYEVYESMEANGGTSSGNNFIDAFANAIAQAEGSDPSINNPGDLTAGDVSASNITGVFNSAGVVIIDTAQNGWNALYSKLGNIFSGVSSVYSPDETLSQFAETYTGGDNAAQWAQSVADSLGVSVDDTLADIQANFSGGGSNEQ